MHGTNKTKLSSLIADMMSASRAVQDLDRREGRFNNVAYETGYQQALLKLADHLGIKEMVNRCFISRPTPNR